MDKKKKLLTNTKKRGKKMNAVTSDTWWDMTMEKEDEKRIKEEKAEKRKSLQEQRKMLAAEKKKLQEKMSQLTKEIKQEKC